MRTWRDINKDSWTFTKKLIVGYGGGIGVYKTSYAINQESGFILNGKISADLNISNRHSTGAGLICRADNLWTFLAFHTAPSAKEGDFTSARISLFKQGMFSEIFASTEEVHLDERFNQFSLEFFSGKVRGEIKTSQKIYELTYTCPHIAFPGYVGLVKFYGTGVSVKNVRIEKTELPFEEKYSLKMKKFEYDIFICHSSKDKPFIIDKIIPVFQQQGITYWFDAEQITYGDPITQKIEEGLQKSKYVMPCLSENLKQSSWTRGEYSAILNAEFSGNSERVTIPLKLENCEDNDIPLLLRDKKRVDYSNQVELAEFMKFLKS
ncbi:toll/interleukin-1 receptor domain-containing protein [Nostoc sp.]|uniref:toll/interleukin-1 receptor domain-containing protein n=1 Tax=Nostoc sp. TaxID=1180 RepID=UPI0035936D4C